MRIAVARESEPAESRVAATPETVKKYLAEMNAAGVGAFGGVHAEEGFHLGKDAVERPRLVAGV